MAIDWSKEKVPRGEVARVRTGRKDRKDQRLAERVTQLDASERINYPAETGMKMNWPVVLRVDEDGLGGIEDLLAAVGLVAPAHKQSTHRLRNAERRAAALDEIDLASPGYRVLGRKRIGEYLGIRPETVTARRKADPAYAAAIRKVGALFVTTMGALDALDVRAQHTRSETGRKNQSARKSNRGGRKPRAASTRG